MVYTELTAHLNALLLSMQQVYYLHASNPQVRGNDREHFRQWAASQEVKSALTEQNPAFAATLVPDGVELTHTLPGLPLLPAGLRVAVDEAGPGQVSCTAEIVGVTFQVYSPTGAAIASTPTALPTRSSITFVARIDGLYKIVLRSAGTVLATLYVPVSRKEFQALRELNRDAAYAFNFRVPHPSKAFTAMIARLIGADALAATGQPELYDTMMTSAARVPHATTPVTVYPNRHA